jgi:hypothetical protein
MSFERVPTGTGIGAEPPIVPAQHEATIAADPAVPPDPGTALEGPPPALRFQILSTEHWSLLATRSLAWNESFTRAGMFLSTLSGSMVALALLAQTSNGHMSGLFALVILPVVLFLGVATFIRLSAANYYDAICVVGMNRIRAGYMELAPDLERYFVMGVHDDPRGVAITQGVEPGTPFGLRMIAATPFVVIVLNSVLAGVIVALVPLQFGIDPFAGVVIGAVGFAVALGIQERYAHRYVARVRSGIVSLFPTPER